MSVNTTEKEPLLTELRRHFCPESKLIHHPLFVGGWYETFDAAHINELYREKKAAAKKAFADHEWSDYIFLHERPYRARALMRSVGSGLTGANYWRIVRMVWIDSENVRQNLPIWKRLWAKDTPGRHLVMHKRERSKLAAMPETIRVWRGTSYRRSVRGLSWTFDVEKAEWFARRFQRHGQKSFIASGLVEKADVYAIFLRRKESKVVSERVQVEALKELSR